MEWRRHIVAVGIGLGVGLVATYALTRMEDLRALVAVVLAVVLLIVALENPRVSLVIMLSWLPLSGIVRRLLDTVSPAAVDPLLAVVPVVAMGMTILAFHSFASSLGRSLRESRITMLTTLLTLVVTMQLLNPLQGNLLVGVAGSLFLLMPMLWYFLGRSYFDRDTVERIFRVGGVLGVLSGLYGLSQALFGFLPFEEAWITGKLASFSALQVGRFIRPFSTFPNPEEWSRYLAFAGTVAMGQILGGGRRRAWWLVVFTISTAALGLSAIRISVFGYLLSLATLVTLTSSSVGVGLRRLAVLLLALAGFLWLVPALSWREVEASNVAWNAFLGHTSRGIRTPFVEDSLLVRLELWWVLFTDVIPRYPLGMGLAAPTLGAMRFDPSVQVTTESYAVSLFVGAGVLGGLLFLAVAVAVTLHSWRVSRSSRDPLVLVTTAFLLGVLFTSLVGNSLSLYTIGPLGWGLMGWMSTLRTREQEARADRRASARFQLSGVR